VVINGPGRGIEREQRGTTVVLRINRPEVRNALDNAARISLGRCIQKAEEDPSVRAIVLTGTGDRAFCAGMDLREFTQGGARALPPEEMAPYFRFMRQGTSKPVIGAANGSAVAGVSNCCSPVTLWSPSSTRCLLFPR
jgi:enoyl-CoA hydratase